MMNAAKEAFAQYLNDTSLDSRQIYFVNQIVEYIVHNGMMKDLSVLQEASVYRPRQHCGSVYRFVRVGRDSAGNRARERKCGGSVITLLYAKSED